MGLLIATAGHIDHGKTSLIKALTGKDTDRLKEEKERGITIELGFAHLELNPDFHLSFIDVPGHQDFIRTMAKGASSVDAFLLCISAKEGIKPQTREHLNIAKILGCKQIVCALTQLDLIENKQLKIVKEEAQSLLIRSGFSQVSLIATSTKTGEGIETLKNQLQELSKTFEKHNLSDSPLFLAVDRVFPIKGSGKILTGTLSFGCLEKGQKVKLYDKDNSFSHQQIKNLQNHFQSTLKIRARQRVGINLQSLKQEQVEPGFCIVGPEHPGKNRTFAAELELLPFFKKGIKKNLKALIYAGPQKSEVQIANIEIAEIRPGTKGLVFLRTKNHLVLNPNLRVLFRSFERDPKNGVIFGGAKILDISPPLGRQKQNPHYLKALQSLKSESFNKFLKNLLILQGSSKKEELKYRFGITKQSLNSSKAFNKDDFIWDDSEFIFLKEAISLQKQEFLEALKTQQKIKNNPSETNEATLFVLKDLLNEDQIKQLDGYWISSAEENQKKSEKNKIQSEILKTILNESLNGLSESEIIKRIKLPSLEIRKNITQLLQEKKLVKIHLDYLENECFQELVLQIKSHLLKNNELSVADFKKLTGFSRKKAIPFLEYLDRQGFTQRKGNLRLAGRKL